MGNLFYEKLHNDENRFWNILQIFNNMNEISWFIQLKYGSRILKSLNQALCGEEYLKNHTVVTC